MKTVAMLATAVTSVIAISSAFAETVVYDAIPAVVPPNVASLGPEAYSGKELGDRITLGAGPRVLKKVDLLLSSWACENGSWTGDPGTCTTTPGATFTHPITLKIYNADGSGPIAEVTQTFTIPFRPSADPGNCGGASTWYDEGTGFCSNGKAVVVTFDSPDLSAITLPSEFIFGVAYDTRSHGYAPIGISGPYDSLNVGLPDSSVYPIPYVGTDSTGPDGVYWYTTYAPFYCDGGTGGLSFREDYADGCWAPYGTVGIRFVTVPPGVEVTLSGFSHPVDPAPTLNKAKSGQAIPLKFFVATTAGAPVADLESVDVSMVSVACGSLISDGSDPIEESATGNSGLINLGGGNYQFNWKTTKGTKGCQVVSLSLPSGYAPTPDKLQAYFEFKK